MLQVREWLNKLWYLYSIDIQLWKMDLKTTEAYVILCIEDTQSYVQSLRYISWLPNVVFE